MTWEDESIKFYVEIDGPLKKCGGGYKGSPNKDEDKAKEINKHWQSILASTAKETNPLSVWQDNSLG